MKIYTIIKQEKVASQFVVNKTANRLTFKEAQNVMNVWADELMERYDRDLYSVIRSDDSFSDRNGSFSIRIYQGQLEIVEKKQYRNPIEELSELAKSLEYIQERIAQINRMLNKK